MSIARESLQSIQCMERLLQCGAWKLSAIIFVFFSINTELWWKQTIEKRTLLCPELVRFLPLVKLFASD